MKLMVWKDKRQFYYLEPVSPPAIRDEMRNKSQRRDSRRSDSREYSRMPNKKYLELLSQNYQVDYSQAEQIAGRSTNLLSIKPKYIPRFGMKIWFDQETFHILKREIVYSQPKEEIQIFHMEYENIRYNEMPPDSILKKDERNKKRKRSRSSRHLREPKRTTYSDITSLQSDLNKPIYLPSFIPKGFEISSISLTKEKYRSVIHLQYTDGLLDFALFQSIGKPPRFQQRMIKESKSTSDRTLVFRQFYACQKDDYSFLLIGNFSYPQLKKIAESLTK
jgi:negative regulator of sigma E activity